LTKEYSSSGFTKMPFNFWAATVIFWIRFAGLPKKFDSPLPSNSLMPSSLILFLLISAPSVFVSNVIFVFSDT